MKVYRRTENGVTDTVSQKTGLDEINHAMMGGQRDVKEMSSITRTDYAIQYRDGRDVRLVLVDAPAPEGYVQGQAVIVQRPGQSVIRGTVAHIHTAPGYVAVEDERFRSVSTHRANFVSAAEPDPAPEPVGEPAAETDDAPWTVAGHRMLLHKFTEASADGRAVCNKSFRPWRYGNGYEFKTRAERESSKYAHLYTFCPRCEKK